jgi:hypothetical protein
MTNDPKNFGCPAYKNIIYCPDYHRQTSENIAYCDFFEPYIFAFAIIQCPRSLERQIPNKVEEELY